MRWLYVLRARGVHGTLLLVTARNYQYLEVFFIVPVFMRRVVKNIDSSPHRTKIGLRLRHILTFAR